MIGSGRPDGENLSEKHWQAPDSMTIAKAV